MGKARSMVSLFFFLVILLVRAERSTAEKTTTEFIFQGFKRNKSDIQLQGDSTITPEGVLRLTDRNSNLAGTAFYHKPVRLLDGKSSVRSFSTCFVFVIIPSSSNKGGFGFTFTLSPTPNRRDAESAQYLGLLNEKNEGNPRNHVFAVEFDTVQGFKEERNRIGNHIGVNFNSLASHVQEPVAYFNKDGKKEDFQLASGEPIQVFVDYDGLTKTVNVTVYPTRLGSKPRIALISQHVPKLLQQVVQEEMFVGFTAATGKDKWSAHYVMGWSFSSGEDATATLNPSELPPSPSPPNPNTKRGYSGKVIGLMVALTIVISIMFLLFVLLILYKRRLQQEEILEDWEVGHPHRFRYKDLYAATDGFKEERIVGSGGFGTVYRGRSVTKSSSDQIAVKKITRNSMQGVREFVAEIESLGRLRHKNVVNLQGWCKHGNDLMLIYDYIPKGCLDSLLHRRSGAVLSWKARYEIAKGIAAGLLYLHEEWEKIVIHRDVKPSNVLIDDHMNPRLGDFGLARLYERGSQSHTTVVVGTIGYMAPELTRNGNSSSASDVFAFGVLLLEMVSGRKPTDSGSFFLGDWVMELQASGEILCAVDPRLGSVYDEEEARLALAVGLICCHPKMGYRPAMGMVQRYLNRDEDVPHIHVSSSRYGRDVWPFHRPSTSFICSSRTRISSSSFIRSTSFFL